jgi:DHA1 family bicyclomycin/chloramphenicol resistance-like MFS transporter
MSALPEPPAPQPHPGMGLVEFVALIAALQAVGALGVDAMLPNLPAIGHALGVAQENRRQLIITVYMLGFGSAQIVYGPLADRFGRRPVLLGGLLLFAAFSLNAALASTFPALLFARLLQGIAAAAVRVVPVSIVRDCYAGRAMARVMSLASLVFMGVPAIAPTLGQAVLRLGPWPLIFAVLAAIALCAFVWALIRLPETLHPQDRLPIRAGRIAAAFRAAATNRTSVAYVAGQTLMFGALMGYIVSSQQLVAETFHAPSLFTAVFALMAGLLAVAALLNSRLVVQIGMRRLSHSGLLAFIALSAIHLALALGGGETLLVFAVFQAGAMLAFGFTSGNFSAMAMEPMGHIAGVAASLQGTVATMGAALIAYVIGQQFNGSAAPVEAGYLICSLLALAATLVAERGRLFRGHHDAPALA